MEPMMAMYAAYVALSVAVTVWVARTLHRSGRVFLLDVFAGNIPLADAVNHLLVVGFCLVNFGYVSLMLRARDAIGTPEAAVEALSWKIGLVLLVLGAMHFTNMIVLAKYRRRAADDHRDRARELAFASDAGRSNRFGGVSFGRTPPANDGFPPVVPAQDGFPSVLPAQGSGATTAPAYPQGTIQREGDAK